MDIKSLVSQMTLEEKASMCSGANFWQTQGIERLGIPPMTVTDGPCGVRKQEGAADHLGIHESVKAISFPTGACVANSFDRDLIRRSGEVLGEECQALDVGILLGPAVNIKRSPLCGRNFEYYSEDPYLSGELAAAYIDGVQSQNIGTSIKHFAANSQEHRRMTSDSIVDERTFREIYLPAFEIAVKNSKPRTVMCSYNKINGTFASDNHRLLTEILRDEWGFENAVVSDWGAVNDRVEGIIAGMDLEMPGNSTENDAFVLEAVKSGKISMEKLDLTVERILKQVYAYMENRKEGAVFDYERDHEFARNLAAESMPLLKNDGILPLCKSGTYAFLGKFAESPRFQGGGSSHVNSYKVTNSIEAAKGINIAYAQGYITEEDRTDDDLLAEAVKTAQNADAAVIFIGIPDALESEGFDRANMKIPVCQEKLIEEVAKVQQNIVIVVECGGAIEMPWIGSVKAVLYAYLGGEAVGAAVNDIIFGDVNPSGKLAETFPHRLEDNPSYLYYIGEGDKAEYREGIFVGYRYYDKKKADVLFPFGHGLSYTNFDYGELTLDKNEMDDTETLTVTCKVKNTGSREGKEIVQLYVGNNCVPGGTIKSDKELRGFEKVSLQPGEEKTVEFKLNKRAFAYYNTELNGWHVESGEYKILIGKSSREIVLESAVAVKSTTQIKRVFTINSTLGDIMSNPKGQEIVGQMMQQANTGMDIDGVASVLGSKEALMEMIGNIPLRTLTSAMGAMGGNKFTKEQAEGLVQLLNS